jgi:DNA-binding response OmpR family regulator
MKINVLLLDDDRELCEEVSEILKDRGFKVDMAHDGVNGQNLMSVRDYDIILLDLKMPVMDGYSLIEYIKSENPVIKIIVVTGRPMNKDFIGSEISKEEDEKNAHILKYADAIITKPFDVDMVISRIIDLKADSC